MAQCLGIGMTHYPGLHMLDEDMSIFLRVTLVGAMAELGYRADIVDYVETHVFNSNKCFALFAQ
jgi:hypothetical protein